MDRGFIQLIIILVILLVIMSLLGVSLIDIVNNKLVKKNFTFVRDFISWLWDNYLHSPVRITWELWVDLLWEPFVEAVKNIKQGGTPVIGQ